MKNDPKLSESLEDYLEVILDLEETNKDVGTPGGSQFVNSLGGLPVRRGDTRGGDRTDRKRKARRPESAGRCRLIWGADSLDRA